MEMDVPELARLDKDASTNIALGDRYIALGQRMADSLNRLADTATGPVSSHTVVLMRRLRRANE